MKKMNKLNKLNKMNKMNKIVLFLEIYELKKNICSLFLFIQYVDCKCRLRAYYLGFQQKSWAYYSRENTNQYIKTKWYTSINSRPLFGWSILYSKIYNFFP